MNRLIKSCTVAALLLPAAAFAADPPDGALTETSLELNYVTGPMPVPNVGANVVAGGAYTCGETNPCDVFELTVDVSETYLDKFPKATVKIAAAATPEYADIDLQVADATGKNIALTRDNPPAQPSATFKVKNGLNKYFIQVVPGSPVPDASVKVTLVPGAEKKSGSSPLAGAFGALLLLPLAAFAALRRRR